MAKQQHNRIPIWPIPMISCSLTAKPIHFSWKVKNLKSQFPNKTHFPVYQQKSKGIARAKRFQLESGFWLDFQSKHDQIGNADLYQNVSGRINLGNSYFEINLNGPEWMNLFMNESIQKSTIHVYILINNYSLYLFPYYLLINMYISSIDIL